MSFFFSPFYPSTKVIVVTEERLRKAEEDYKRYELERVEKRLSALQTTVTELTEYKDSLTKELSSVSSEKELAEAPN